MNPRKPSFLLCAITAGLVCLASWSCGGGEGDGQDGEQEGDDSSSVPDDGGTDAQVGEDTGADSPADSPADFPADLPDCGEGAITAPCTCGGAAHADGYCCSGTWRADACGTALPVGEWFDIEMYYQWTTGTTTLSLWINGELALEQSGVQTRDASHETVETYIKFYGSTQGGTPWSPTPSIRYTRNVRVAGERIWR